MKILIYDSGYGLLSVVREIIKQKKNNDYYLYIDKEFFPVGNKKPKDLRKHLLELLEKWKVEKYDKIILACNTMSLVYKNYFSIDKKIICIGDYTLFNYDDSYQILATPTFCKMINKKYDSQSTILAEHIEKRDIKSIIVSIKKMKFSKPKIILGCTHYPLIKSIFMFYHQEQQFFSYERELVNSLKSGSSLSFTSNIDIDQFLSSIT